MDRKSRAKDEIAIVISSRILLENKGFKVFRVETGKVADSEPVILLVVNSELSCEDDKDSSFELSGTCDTLIERKTFSFSVITRVVSASLYAQLITGEAVLDSGWKARDEVAVRDWVFPGLLEELDDRVKRPLYLINVILGVSLLDIWKLSVGHIRPSERQKKLIARLMTLVRDPECKNLEGMSMTEVIPKGALGTFSFVDRLSDPGVSLRVLKREFRHVLKYQRLKDVLEAKGVEASRSHAKEYSIEV